jgi:membrane protease YdiL (CAAX protease family)
MDASGLSLFSALPLFPLMVLFWYWEGVSRVGIGLVWGQLRTYGLALLHPVVVLGLLALAASFNGAIHLDTNKWHRAWLGVAVGVIPGVLVLIVTEEGFFRGWLWASLKRAGQSDGTVLAWSTVAFTAWHLSPIFLDTDFKPPLAQAPILLLNVAVLGAIWGMLRIISGSVVVGSLGHSVWNVIAYGFFGLGTKVGALGIQETAIYGPEVGILGLVLNLLFLAALMAAVQARKYAGMKGH